MNTLFIPCRIIGTVGNLLLHVTLDQLWDEMRWWMDGWMDGEGYLTHKGVYITQRNVPFELHESAAFFDITIDHKNISVAFHFASDVLGTGVRAQIFNVERALGVGHLELERLGVGSRWGELNFPNFVPRIPKFVGTEHGSRMGFVGKCKYQ